ncbi:alpha-L-fucosidase [Enterococcus sp. LJL120]
MTIREDIEENLQTAQEDYQQLSETIRKKLAWFQDQKVGVIFHWGLYSEAGVVESWQLSKADDWARKKPWRKDLKTLREDYWGLNQVFNPINFDPQDWAGKCRAAGFRYVLFTTKHHDGFNMYDTQESEYKITANSSPFYQNENADIFGAVMESFQKAGIATGAYYSKADWHCPFYWVPGEVAAGRQASYSPKENPAMWHRFETFVGHQLQEICTNYGPIEILWLDAGWVNSGQEQLNMKKIVGELRKRQPDMLVVDRTIGGEFENYVTPERKIPEVAPLKAWESNIPFAKNWGYVPNDVYKPFSEILETLLKIVSLGGNVIFGVGPKPDGTLPKQAEILMDKLGSFLNNYGEGIYGTRAVPNLVVEGWYFTKKAQAIYAFSLVPEKRTVTLDTSYLKELFSVTEAEHLKTGVKIDFENPYLSFSNQQEVIALKFSLSKSAN